MQLDKLAFVENVYNTTEILVFRIEIDCFQEWTLNLTRRHKSENI